MNRYWFRRLTLREYGSCGSFEWQPIRKPSYSTSPLPNCRLRSFKTSQSFPFVHTTRGWNLGMFSENARSTFYKNILWCSVADPDPDNKGRTRPWKHLSDKKLSNLFFNLEKMSLPFFFFHTVRANAFIFKFFFCFLS